MIEIVNYFDGIKYISGFGGDNYQDADLFQKENISLLKTSFSLNKYSQLTDNFIPGLSIMDALFNIGAHDIRELI